MWSKIRNWYCFLVILSCKGILGQTNLASPYSAFGIGQVQRSALSRNFALAGVGNALADPFAINVQNPASISHLQTMAIDFSGYVLWNTVQSQEQRAHLHTTGFYGLSLVFKKKSPLAFIAGVSPYSVIGYKFKNISNIEGDTLPFIAIRTGQGGIVDYYLGGGYSLGHKKLSIGLTLHYLSGQANAQTITQLPFTYAKVFVKERYFRGISYRLGFIFSDTLKAISRETFYRLGGVIEWGPSISLNQGQALYQYRNFLDVSAQNVPFNLQELVWIQTLEQTQNLTLALPPSYGWGLGLEKFLHYSIGLDMRLQNWKNFQLTSANPTLGLNLALAGGTEWIPDYQNTKSIFARAAYRLGAGWEKTYLQLNGRSINAWRLTLGWGLPLNLRIPSRINFGLEIETRGTLQNNLIRETIYRWVIGLNFNEIWVEQRKYN